VAWRGEFFGGGFDLDRVRIGGAEYNRWVITSLALIVPETAWWAQEVSGCRGLKQAGPGRCGSAGPARRTLYF
jgi:hypothetical protein